MRKHGKSSPDPASEHPLSSRARLKPAGPAIDRRAQTRSKHAQPEQSAAKERFTVQLPVTLIERARDAVYWTPGVTLTSLAEDGLSAAVERLERQRGSAFPKRTHALKSGRPVK